MYSSRALHLVLACACSCYSTIMRESLHTVVGRSGLSMQQLLHEHHDAPAAAPQARHALVCAVLAALPAASLTKVRAGGALCAAQRLAAQVAKVRRASPAARNNCLISTCVSCYSMLPNLLPGTTDLVSALHK